MCASNRAGSNIIKLDDMSLSECTCRTWISCMQMTVIRMWLRTAQPQNTYTHKHHTGTV